MASDDDDALAGRCQGQSLGWPVAAVIVASAVLWAAFFGWVAS